MLWFAPVAWVGRLARAVLVRTDGDRITAIEEDARPPADAVRMDDVMLPGLVNAHSHAFHRALRGHAGGGDFWEWREEMYRLAASLDPDSYFRLARAGFAEMALAGITTVGEFHYLHHDPDGRPYTDPNEMSLATIRAAAEAGVRLSLLDTCYLRGDFDTPLQGAQVRFADGSAEAWAERVALMTESPLVRIGAAVHSVRAVDEHGVRLVSDWAQSTGRPLHVHVSEQPAENERCLAATGHTPTELLERAGLWQAASTAVHATHASDDDIGILAAAGAHVCVCPTTERDLADGIGPVARMARAGVTLAVGTDSHARIDILEEARLLELHERLLTGRRGLLDPEALLRAATSGGASSLGWDPGPLRPGALADLISVRLDTPRTAGMPDSALARVVYGATPADVDTVVVGGRTVVRNGRHLLIEDVGRALADAISSVRARK